MKKAIIIIVSLGGFMMTGFVVMRLTHVIDFYKISSSSNQPTYYPGSLVFASSLKNPDYNNFVCFRNVQEKEVWMFRCIGKEGDMIEIKNASVYVNGKLVDASYCWNEYSISENQLKTIKGYVDRYNYPLSSVNDSLFNITLSQKDLNNYHLNLKLHIAGKGKVNDQMYPEFEMLKYNEDNLGPVKVPHGCYFLLGDNRHGAMDSRYLGFVSHDEVISTVIN